MGTHSAVRNARKPLLRRTTPDRSQRIRLTVQILFAALNLALGIQFYIWARYYERGGTGLYVPRPAGAEGWLPIAGLMNLKLMLVTGHVPAIHPAAMFLLISFVLISLVAKKAFCAWLCPVGALSERIGKLGRMLFRRRIHLPRWLDVPFRGLKYLLLALLRVLHRGHARRDAAIIYAHALRSHRRRQDAQLLPQHERDRGRGRSGSCAAFAGD